MTLVVWIAVLAFPVVVALAWIFTLEAGRMRRERAASAAAARAVVLGVIGITLVLGLVAWRVWLRTGTAVVLLDEAAVAVLPFRTAGADPELSYLGEGLVDLLAAKFTGEVGPRAIDPRAVTSAWRRAAGVIEAELPEDSALVIARSLGAAGAIIGSIVGSPSQLTLTAVLIRSDGRGTRAQASVDGPVTDLLGLVDRLAATLLSLESGHDARELEPLASAPFPALVHYLRGEAAYRRGDYGNALESFRRAMDIDSTFAVAAFGFERAAPWVGGWEDARERARNLAWTYRDRLSRLDRAHLEGRAGPRHPRHPTARELLEARRQAVQLMPDRAEVWYELGDLYFHWGWVLGEENILQRALESFRPAMDLDPDFAAVLQHSLMAAAASGDTGTYRALSGRLEPESSVRYFGRWRRALAAGDEAELQRFRAAMNELPDEALGWIAVISQDDGLPLSDAHRAQAILGSRPSTPSEARAHLMRAHALALNAGRPAEALRALDAYRDVAIDPAHPDRIAVLDALYAGGDSARAEAAARMLEAGNAGAESGPAPAALDLENRCVAAQWHLWQGREVPAGDLARRARAAADARGSASSQLTVCAEIIEALATPPGDARTAILDRLDEYLLLGPFTGITDLGQPYYANIALARLRERDGDLDGALAAIRRRIYFHGQQPYNAVFFLTEARLRARLGMREGAIAAYRRYLAMRADPAPERQAEADAARAELAVLLDTHS